MEHLITPFSRTLLLYSIRLCCPDYFALHSLCCFSFLSGLQALLNKYVQSHVILEEKASKYFLHPVESTSAHCTDIKGFIDLAMSNISWLLLFYSLFLGEESTNGIPSAG